MHKQLLFLIIIWGAFAGVVNATHDDQAFLASFIKHYEFSPEGRYVHEYHPFLLTKTIESFKQLEERLTHEGFNLKGRNVIFGYEENAVPNYYTDFRKSKIQDEASLQNRIGWSLKLHNRFGFMTGFLFKDIEKIKKGCGSIFSHINASSISIFDDRAFIFQEHAFGEAVDLVFKAKESIMRSVNEGNERGVFTWLIKFWQMLYSNALKVSNDQVAGTQDILFSIEYAKYLFNSKYPLYNFFIGPDITYPIEVFAKQDRDVTKNAQTFVRRFVHELHPLEGKKTAYMFCSFVDGVGKSTMLGNIKNWMKHGDDIDNFGHVDNSSSQLAELFQFKEDTYIVDMPAQISHFTYKPDGMVFVDVLTKHDEEIYYTLREFAVAHREEIEQSYARQLKDVEATITKEGYFAASLQDASRPDRAFIRNLFLLGKVKDSFWMPFVYQGDYYLVNGKTFREIRYLTSLAEVTSEGLKNIESEQMLFCDGVRLPLSFDIFLNDLIQKLRQHGIENIVFVDFASMYPRSCRENIRINYLVQQLALLDEQFKVKNSAYRDFISASELLYLLKNSKTLPQVFHAFQKEALVRLLFSKMIDDQNNSHLSGILLRDMTNVLQQQLSQIPQSLRKQVHDYAQEKMAIETKNLEKLYGNSKPYVNIQMLSWDNVALFSTFLHDFITEYVYNPTLEKLWSLEWDLPPLTVNSVNEVVANAKGDLVKVHSYFDHLCKNDLVVASAARMIRASWYAALGNVLFAQGNIDTGFALSLLKYFVPPVSVQKQGDAIAILQRYLQPSEEEAPRAISTRESIFNVSPTKEYGTFDGEFYRMDWNSRSTYQGLFAYSASVIKGKGMKGYAPVITRLVQKYQQEHSCNMVMPTSELFEKLEESVYWEVQRKSMRQQATRNGKVNLTAEEKKAVSVPKNSKQPVRSVAHKIFFARYEQYEAIRMVVRLLATLDMVLKDPDADVVIRYGNREDFKAAIKLLETVTLPKYFGLYLEKPLFEDYNLVEPYPSWEAWD